MKCGPFTKLVYRGIHFDRGTGDEPGVRLKVTMMVTIKIKSDDGGDNEIKSDDGGGNGIKVTMLMRIGV